MPQPAAVPARRAVSATAGLLALATAVVGLPAATAAAGAAPAVVHVSPAGDDRDAGSASAPVATLGHAVRAVAPGGRVVVHEGTYHESVDLPYGKTVHVAGAPGETAVLDGSEVVRRWVRDGDDWRAADLTVHADRRDTSGLMVDPAFPASAMPEQLFVDGTASRQVVERRDVVPGTFYVDPRSGAVVTGDDPDGAEIRVSTLDDALYVNHGHGSSLRDLVVRRYATPTARVAAVKAFADDVVVEGLLVEDTAMAGISAKGDDVVVRGSTVRRNGQLGLHGHHTDDLLLEDNTVVANNTEGFRVDQAAGGVKVTQSRRTVLRGNDVQDNRGTGVWLDESANDAVAVDNLLAGNSRHGFCFEVSAGLVFAGNTVADNGEAGLRVLEAGHVDAWHNSFRDNRRSLDMVDGARTSTDARHRAHDSRHPTDLSRNTWDVEQVRWVGNAVSVADGGYFLVGLEHADRTTSFDGRGIVVQDTAWHRADEASSRWYGAWADYPERMRASRDHAGFVRDSGQDTRGVDVVGGTTPFTVAGPDGRDVVAPGSPAGLAAPLPALVAQALAVPAGRRLPVGPARMDRPAPQPAPMPPTPAPAPEPAPAPPPVPPRLPAPDPAPAPVPEPAPAPQELAVSLQAPAFPVPVPLTEAVVPVTVTGDDVAGQEVAVVVEKVVKVRLVDGVADVRRTSGSRTFTATTGDDGTASFDFGVSPVTGIFRMTPQLLDAEGDVVVQGEPVVVRVTRR